MTDPKTGEEVQDIFTIICRAVRAKDSITVYIPRLLNVFRAGSYKSRLEVVLENRLFVPLSEEIQILEPVKVGIKPIPVQESAKPIEPEVTVSLTNVITALLNQSKEKAVVESVEPVKEEKTVVESKPKSEPFEAVPPVDISWKTNGFQGIKNPFKK
jgi:hypothetical protein